MITVICSSKFESLMMALGAKIVAGKWSLNQLSNAHKELLEAESAIIEGCRYMCWNIWFSNLYQISRDTRCSVSFNTLAKRAGGLVDLNEAVVGRAKVRPITRRRGNGTGYRIEYQDQVFPSEAALARHFGIDPIKFRSRRQLGWTIEESLK
jgi:hypothetical protein